jgi:4-hydroxy-tetrahydrodipicolinate synthase
MKTLDLEGLIPATLTPMTERFEVDEAGLRSYIQWILQFDGLKAVAINMDTGEGPHLTKEEKKRIVSIWKEEVSGRFPILAGVGGPSTADAIREAREAEEKGADGLVIFPIPAYTGQPLPHGIPLKYHETIADSVDIPLVLFQLQPSLGGVIFEPELLERLMQIDSVIAIKEASFDMVTFVKTAELVGHASHKIILLTGNDNFILESFLMGADGALIGFGTILIAEQIDMIERLKTGDVPGALSIYREKVLPLANGIFCPPVRNYRARLKEALTMMGAIESSIMRPPLLALEDSEKENILNLLKKTGLAV